MGPLLEPERSTSSPCAHRMEGPRPGHLVFSRVPAVRSAFPFHNDLGETPAPWPFLWLLGCVGPLPGVSAEAGAFPKLATLCRPQWW